MKLLRSLIPVMIVLAGCEPLIYRANTPAPPGLAGNLPPAQGMLAQFAASRPDSPVKGFINGEPVLVDYNPGDAGTCGSMLVTYQNLAYSETWEACADGKITRSAGEAGVLPKNGDFAAIRHAVSQGAWKFGEAQAVFADYEIFAAAVGHPDTSHCQTVENSVVQNERTVDTSHERVCGER